jgi:hypothetical protein
MLHFGGLALIGGNDDMYIHQDARCGNVFVSSGSNAALFNFLFLQFSHLGTYM